MPIAEAVPFIAPWLHESSELVMRYVETPQGNYRCNQLRGIVGDCVSCAVYEDRPKVCRTFEPASQECNAVRQVIHKLPKLIRTKLL